MSLLKYIRAQLGLSNTAANNFTFDASADNGTMKLARGNAGATTQDVLTVDASGVVDHPQGLKIAGASGQRMLLTASQSTTAGTAIDFTGIPSWAKKITVQLFGVSGSGTSNMQLQLGAGSFTTTGYESDASTASGTLSTSTTGLLFTSAIAASYSVHGTSVLSNITGNAWVQSGTVGVAGVSGVLTSGGSVTISGTLDRIRLTTVNGTDTFDAGSVSLLIEGY